MNGTTFGSNEAPKIESGGCDMAITTTTIIAKANVVVHVETTTVGTTTTSVLRVKRAQSTLAYAKCKARRRRIIVAPKATTTTCELMHLHATKSHGWVKNLLIESVNYIDKSRKKETKWLISCHHFMVNYANEVEKEGKEKQEKESGCPMKNQDQMMRRG